MAWRIPFRSKRSFDPERSSFPAMHFTSVVRGLLADARNAGIIAGSVCSTAGRLFPEEGTTSTQRGGLARRPVSGLDRLPGQAPALGERSVTQVLFEPGSSF